jgi:hypothetical protein
MKPVLEQRSLLAPECEVVATAYSTVRECGASSVREREERR